MLNKKLPNGSVLGAFIKDNETAKGIVIGCRQPGDATTKGVVMLMCDNDGKTHLIINKDLLEELNGEIVLKTYNEGYLPAGFDPIPATKETNQPETIVSSDHTFTVVDEVPLGYEIWNIGKHMVDGYLPFCRVLPGEDRRVEIDTLKAIKCEGAQTILAAIGAGHKTIAEMEAFIEENRDKHPLTWEYAQVQKMYKALPFMRQLRWPTNK